MEFLKDWNFWQLNFGSYLLGDFQFHNLFLEENLEKLKIGSCLIVVNAH